MGAVYEAVHEVIQRRVAINVLHAEAAGTPDAVQRFLNEARAANLIGHPGLAQVTDFGTLLDGSGYLVMEYLDGQTLDARLQAQGGSLPPEDVVQIGIQIASALAACHKKNIIHRDLKPSNAMLVADPATATGERVKVLDFGLAKLVEVHEAALVKTQSQAILGTPLYMSPEQCDGAGSVDAKTDVYALGCILYELLAGRPPFLGESVGQVIGQHLFKPPEPLSARRPQIPVALSDLVTRLLTKARDERPSSRDALQALEALASTLPPPRRREPADPSGGLTASTLAEVGLAATLGQAAAETPSKLAHASTLGQGAEALGSLSPARRRSRLIAGGLALLAAIGLFWAAFALLRPRSQATTTAAAPPPPPPAVTTRVDSQPSGAQVLDAASQQILGQTPWQRQAAAQAGSQRLLLRLDGHSEQGLEVPLSRDEHATVQLAPLPSTQSRDSHAKAAAPAGKKPVLKRIAAPIKKLAGKIADSLKKKPAAKSTAKSAAKPAKAPPRWSPER